jgi:RHS repeat-associated protein
MWHDRTASIEIKPRFVRSGWLMLLELDGMAGGGTGILPVMKKYTWGLDLAGLSDGVGTGGVGVSPASLASAGGVGGLLAMEDMQDPNDPNDSLNYAYLYDANGNVGQLIDWAHDPNDPAGAIVARYEYDPYGDRTNYDPNVPEYEQPFRWSAKYWDDDTGLGYWGQRYYNPALARWLSRDPIEDLGGVNLYAYVGNDPVNWVDPLGLMWLLCPDYPNCPGQDGPCPGKPPWRPPPRRPVTPPRRGDWLDCMADCIQDNDPLPSLLAKALAALVGMPLPKELVAQLADLVGDHQLAGKIRASARLPGASKFTTIPSSLETALRRLTGQGAKRALRILGRLGNAAMVGYGLALAAVEAHCAVWCTAGTGEYDPENGGNMWGYGGPGNLGGLGGITRCSAYACSYEDETYREQYTEKFGVLGVLFGGE